MSNNHPRALSSITVSIGLLAVFITVASWIFLSYPIGSVVRSYFYGVENSDDLDLPVTLEAQVQMDKNKLLKSEDGAEGKDEGKSNVTVDSGQPLS